MGKVNKGPARKFSPLFDQFKEQEDRKTVHHIRICNVENLSNEDVEIVSVQFEIVEMEEFFTHKFYRERD